MDISIYQDFFHDGSLIAIDYSKNTNDLTLTMKSAEVDPEELPGTILLSSDDSITGKLHVINIKSIEVNEKPFFGILTKDYDSAEILDFEMENHSTLLLGIQWGNYPPKARVDNFSTIIIKAEKMWWENIPDLEA